jgi:hypothetical protein
MRGSASMRASSAANSGPRCRQRRRAPLHRETVAARMSSAPSRSPESHGVAGNWSAKISHSSVSRAPPARLHRRLDGIVGVGIPALGIVEDADAGVAVGGDVDEAADLLCAPRRVGAEKAALRMGEAEVIRIAALSVMTLPSSRTSVGICATGLTRRSSSKPGDGCHDAASTLR